MVTWNFSQYWKPAGLGGIQRGEIMLSQALWHAVELWDFLKRRYWWRQLDRQWNVQDRDHAEPFSDQTDSYSYYKTHVGVRLGGLGSAWPIVRGPWGPPTPASLHDGGHVEACLAGGIGSIFFIFLENTTQIALKSNNLFINLGTVPLSMGQL